MRVRTAGLALVGLSVIGVIGPSLRAQETTRSVWDGVYTEAQAKRGEAIYKLNCASCHGVALEGIEQAGPLSMPNDRPGTLSRQQTADVLAYVFSFNRFPAGKAELARQTELLKQIKFEATRPTSRH